MARSSWIVFLVLVPLAVEWPVLSGQRIPASWNPGGSDLLLQFFPHRKVLWDALAHGGWPAWTGAVYGGYPLLASMQAGLCDPLTLPCAALATVPALGLFLLLHRLVAVSGAYALARRLGHGAPGAAAAGLVFAYSGFFVGNVVHLDVFSCASFTPWIVLALVDGQALRLALLLAWAFHCGNPQQFAYTGVLAVLFFLLAGEGSLRTRARGFARVLPGLAGWVLLVLPQLLPALAFLSASSRSGSLSADEILGSSFPVPALAGMFWGWAQGSLADGTHAFVRGRSFWAESTIYAGVLAPWAFGAQAFVRVPRAERALAWTGVAALLVALGPLTPVGVVWAHLPGIALFRGLFRAMLFVELALALAVSRAITEVAARGGRPALVAALAVLCAADVVHFQVRERCGLPAREYLAEPRVVRLLGDARVWRRTFTLEPGALQGAAYRESPGVPPGAELHVLAREELFPSIGLFWGVPSLGGFSGLGDRRADAIADLAWRSPGARTLLPAVERTLEAMGVTHVLAKHPLADPNLQAAGEVGLWDDHRVYVYRLARTLGAGRVVPRARVMKDVAAVIGRMEEPDFDPCAEVLLEEAAPAVTSPAPGHAVRELTFGVDAIEVVLEPGSTGWLVLPFSYDVAWETSVGAVRRGNFNALAIALERPVDRVRLSYRPRGLVGGLAVSGAVLAGLLIYWGTCRR